MAFRRFLRGEIPDERVESVAREVADRYGAEPRYEYLEADNWLSTPIVVDDRWFVKIISEQHSLVHAVLTAGRNLGAFTSGVEGFFEHFGTPVEMAEHELRATRRMRELGVNAPEPLEAFAHDDLGVLVLEYLPAFRTVDELSTEEVAAHAPALFESLATMHEAGLAHGDLRAENVLVAAPPEGEPPSDAAAPSAPSPPSASSDASAPSGREVLYFIDATSVRADAIGDARAYDIASALGALEPHVGAAPAVEAALSAYAVDDLLAAREFLDFVKIRPDHDFDAAALKGEIEKAAS